MSTRAFGEYPALAGRLLLAAAGWLLLYIAIGGLGLFVVRAPYSSEPTCLPFHTMGGITSSCPNEAVNLLWLVALGIPTFVVELSSLSVSIALDAFRQGEPLLVLDGLGYWIASIPLLIVAILGVMHWRRTGSPIGWIAVAVLIAEILAWGMWA